MVVYAVEGKILPCVKHEGNLNVKHSETAKTKLSHTMEPDVNSRSLTFNLNLEYVPDDAREFKPVESYTKRK